jgi:hypothetical protein
LIGGRQSPAEVGARAVDHGNGMPRGHMTVARRVRSGAPATSGRRQPGLADIPVPACRRAARRSRRCTFCAVSREDIPPREPALARRLQPVERRSLISDRAAWSGLSGSGHEAVPESA